MKHTKNYMDAMWVIQNPEKYDNRDVVRANSFIEAYKEGYNKAFSLRTVVGQSEQLIGFLIYLNKKGLINNYDFVYEEEAKEFVKMEIDKNSKTNA